MWSDGGWFSYGSVLVQLWVSCLSPDVFWRHVGSDVVHLSAWHNFVWLSFVSVVGGLSLDCAAMMPRWCRLVCGLVQLWHSMDSVVSSLVLVGSAWVQFVA